MYFVENTVTGFTLLSNPADTSADRQRVKRGRSFFLKNFFVSILGNKGFLVSGLNDAGLEIRMYTD